MVTKRSNKKKLINMCRKQGLRVTGTKRDLIDRLNSYNSDYASTHAKDRIKKAIEHKFPGAEFVEPRNDVENAGIMIVSFRNSLSRMTVKSGMTLNEILRAVEQTKKSIPCKKTCDQHNRHNASSPDEQNTFGISTGRSKLEKADELYSLLILLCYL